MNHTTQSTEENERYKPIIGANLLLKLTEKSDNDGNNEDEESLEFKIEDSNEIPGDIELPTFVYTLLKLQAD